MDHPSEPLMASGPFCSPTGTITGQPGHSDLPKVTTQPLLGPLGQAQLVDMISIRCGSHLQVHYKAPGSQVAIPLPDNLLLVQQHWPSHGDLLANLAGMGRHRVGYRVGNSHER